MKLISCSIVLTLLLSGCSHTRPQIADDSATDVLLSAPGLVKGRALYVIYGVPGVLSEEEEGESIPPEPIPGVAIHFKGYGRTYTVTSEQDGTYQIELPAGNYRIGWIAPWEKDAPEEVDPFRSRPLPKMLTEIEVDAGEEYEKDIPVESTFID